MKVEWCIVVPLKRMNDPENLKIVDLVLILQFFIPLLGKQTNETNVKPIFFLAFRQAPTYLCWSSIFFSDPPLPFI